MSDGYWFKSSLFEIEPGEDEEINPGIYGRQVATWLRQKLDAAGFTVEDVLNEDWGRCLMCQRSPFALWVGVSSVDDEERVDGMIPTKDSFPGSKIQCVPPAFILSRSAVMGNTGKITCSCVTTKSCIRAQ